MRMDRSGRPMLSFVWLDDVAMRVPLFVLMSATQPNSDNRRGATAGRMLSSLSDEVPGARGVIPHRPINFSQGILFARSRASRWKTAYSQPNSPAYPCAYRTRSPVVLLAVLVLLLMRATTRARGDGPLPARSNPSFGRG